MPNYAFGSKESLYRAVLDRAFALPRSLVARLASGLEGGNGGEALASLVGAYIDFLAASPNYVRLLQRATLEGGETVERNHDQLHKPSRMVSGRGGAAQPSQITKGLNLS